MAGPLNCRPAPLIIKGAAHLVFSQSTRNPKFAEMGENCGGGLMGEDGGVGGGGGWVSKCSIYENIY